MTALGTTPERAMRQGLARSDWTATGLLDGVPVCMFGVAPVNLMLGRGAPWMLAATGLDRMPRSEEHTSELQSLMRISYAVFCLKKKKKQREQKTDEITYQNNH